MMDTFFLIGLPYLAIVIAIVGCIWRVKYQQYGMSARSSQFLEDKQLLWGAAPWHMGIGIVLLGHILAWLFPGVWSTMMAVPGLMIGVEVIGVAASILALLGLVTLFVRRLLSAPVQAVTTTADLGVVLLLLVQVSLGLATALTYPYGAAWGVKTAVPYLWGILLLHPDAALVADFPTVFKLHIMSAWMLILLLPFTRLMHLFALPFSYLWRAPQRVIWNNSRRYEHRVEAELQSEARREFIKGSVALAGAGGLLALGLSGKVLSYFGGPKQDPDAEALMLQKKLERLQQTAEERALELERRRNEVILVARYSELTEKKGRYFTAYSMAPGLAFRGADGIPIVRSAKCTHLGCTVGSEVDAQGRILCPCHISYFNVTSGIPNDGAPAKLPLPELPWALMDAAGAVVMKHVPGQPAGILPDAAVLAGSTLYIMKPTGEV